MFQFSLLCILQNLSIILDLALSGMKGLKGTLFFSSNDFNHLTLATTCHSGRPLGY